MADGEEDFSSLPLSDRWVHKVWKVRKEAYEAGAKAFDAAQSENDPLVRQFTNDSSLWKGAVADSNVAAQQEGLGALISFLQIAGKDGCVRTRGSTIAPIVEKGLAATRPAAKQKALEAILLYIELDKAEPIIEELLPFMSHKQPKIIAATLGAVTQIYHAYGCKTVEPKAVLKILPKVFGHADKNVRAESQKLAVEFYRWLKEAMKPLFWGDLKPVQQQDLEKLFDQVKDEPPPKQERLLRSQQAKVEQAAATGGGEEDDEVEDEAEVEIDLDSVYEAVNVFPKIPSDLQERLASSKWKDRKEGLEDLQKAINHPRIAEGQFDEILRGLAKCMKDANIQVVIIAANCIELLATGLKKSFSRYRGTVMSPIMERLKEKKQSVTDALGAALDAVFASTSLSDCLEDILECLKHKNPQVKLESTRFLTRCLKTTRDAPQPPEVKAIADASIKLLTESQEVQRNAGAEVLGTLWKIMGDRAMGPHLNDLDEIRKTKIKEFCEAAEVKAKVKPPKAAPPPKAPPGKRPVGKKPAAAKKAAPAPAPAYVEPPSPAPVQTPRPAARPISKIGGPKSGLKAPGGLRPPGGLQKRIPAPALSSPVRNLVSSDDEPAPPPPKPMANRGLASRPLGKPAAQQQPESSMTVSGLSGLSSAERAELEELRMENDRLRRENEMIRHEKQKLSSQYAELDDHNKELIEKHTQDHLSIKAKEAQLTRARSDAEALEQQVQSQQREIERLKRELSRQVRASSPAPMDLGVDNAFAPSGAESPGLNNGYGGYRNSRSYVTSPTAKSMASGLGFTSAEGKENFAPRNGMGAFGTGSPRSSRLGMRTPDSELPPTTRPSQSSSLSSGAGRGNADGESWKRAAEVTQNLKARIEQMKAKQGLSSRPR
ncbi:ARM repeat-containing protein [Microthyrium microscopicum]|uniref:ARM repeat-containing protein n=1 Tax=Microthyrium microscopicum TaxID=703497 RepID=A0A6A6UQY2_9PEZI|nr:ARM repeat-containing protein [Microthyrium microscopicum]